MLSPSVDWILVRKLQRKLRKESIVTADLTFAPRKVQKQPTKLKRIPPSSPATMGKCGARDMVVNIWHSV